jgi:hypothetical protein
LRYRNKRICQQDSVVVESLDLKYGCLCRGGRRRSRGYAVDGCGVDSGCCVQSQGPPAAGLDDVAGNPDSGSDSDSNCGSEGSGYVLAEDSEYSKSRGYLLNPD